VGEAAHVGHGLLGVGHEGLTAFVDILVPLAGGVAGFFAKAAVGGSYSIAAVVNSAFFNNQGASAGRIGAAVMAGILAGIGYLFWGIRHRGGMVMKLLGGGIGGFFFGAAFGQVPTIIKGGVDPQGAFDKLFAWTQDVATGRT
jgi:hypothetical protein